MRPLEGKRILITGGTGSLGKTLVNACSPANGMAREDHRIFPRRSQAVFHALEFQSARPPLTSSSTATSKSCWNSGSATCAISAAWLRCCDPPDVVFNAAAMKQVPTCEYFPFEAVRTNIEGAENIVARSR